MDIPTHIFRPNIAENNPRRSWENTFKSLAQQYPPAGIRKVRGWVRVCVHDGGLSSEG